MIQYMIFGTPCPKSSVWNKLSDVAQQLMAPNAMNAKSERMTVTGFL
jgi:hypothetical protein